jgi:hypothetical protein
MPSLSEAERLRVQQRMTDWVRLSPAERGRARVQFQESRQIAPETRQQRWNSYQSLPADQRQALAAKASQGENQAPLGQTKTKSEAAGPEGKRNVLSLPSAGAPVRPVAPTVVQARQGATTSLVNSTATPPAHHQAGLPKINASEGFVDPATLLPRRGPQGAAAARPLGFEGARRSTPVTLAPSPAAASPASP